MSGFRKVESGDYRNMTQCFTENLLAGFIFFVLEVLLVTILRPLIFRWSEERRWRTTWVGLAMM